MSSMSWSSSSSNSYDLDLASERAMWFLQMERGYKYLEHMAKGSYGVVVTMYDDRRGTPIAVKCATEPGDMEMKAWPSFRHPNLVPLLEIILLDCCAVFVMPLYRKDLWMVVDSDNFYKDPLSFGMCRMWLKDTVRALAYLHEKSLAHLDLKLDNVFVKDNGHVCLGDYSLMAAVEDVTVGFVFLEHFKPPEFTPDYEELTTVKLQDVILRGDTADMWEFGIFTLDLLTNRKVSIEKNSDYEVWKYDVFPYIQKIVKDKSYLKHSMKNCFESMVFTEEDIDSCEDFLNRTLNTMPSNRISAKEALSHPFINVEWPLIPKTDAPPAILLQEDKATGGLRPSTVEIESLAGTRRISIRSALEAMMIREESLPEWTIEQELVKLGIDPNKIIVDEESTTEDLLRMSLATTDPAKPSSSFTATDPDQTGISPDLMKSSIDLENFKLGPATIDLGSTVTDPDSGPIGNIHEKIASPDLTKTSANEAHVNQVTTIPDTTTLTNMDRTRTTPKTNIDPTRTTPKTNIAPTKTRLDLATKTNMGPTKVAPYLTTKTNMGPTKVAPYRTTKTNMDPTKTGPNLATKPNMDRTTPETRLNPNLVRTSIVPMKRILNRMGANLGLTKMKAEDVLKITVAQRKIEIPPKGSITTEKKDPELIPRKKKFKKVKHKKTDFKATNLRTTDHLPIGQKAEGLKPSLHNNLKKKKFGP